MCFYFVVTFPAHNTGTYVALLFRLGGVRGTLGSLPWCGGRIPLIMTQAELRFRMTPPIGNASRVSSTVSTRVRWPESSCISYRRAAIN